MGTRFDPAGALRELGLDAANAESLLGWCVAHHRGPGARTALDLYVEERGGALDDEGRRVVDLSDRAILRRLVEEKLGALATFRVRERADPVAQLGGRASRGRSGLGDALPPEALEAPERRSDVAHLRRRLGIERDRAGRRRGAEAGITRRSSA